MSNAQGAGGAMKTVLAVLLFATVAFSQDPSDAARAASGCGPSGTKFDVQIDKKQHPTLPPEADKAIIYIFQDAKRDSNARNLGSTTTRVGLDGVWVGANHGKSYFFVLVNPGDHHLCVAQQTMLKTSKPGSALSLTAEAGKVYYFRADVQEKSEAGPGIELETIDSAEGQSLIANSSLSISEARE
jgi:Protein of unknown function (DUF2846)